MDVNRGEIASLRHKVVLEGFLGLHCKSSGKRENMGFRGLNFNGKIFEKWREIHF